jgi:hypothetical protein
MNLNFLDRLLEQEERIMRTLAMTALALAFIGATEIGTTASVKADGFYFNAPGVHIGVGDPWHHRHYYDYSPGRAYGGGWNTWNGCPPDYTIQGGVCKPYIGPRW